MKKYDYALTHVYHKDLIVCLNGENYPWFFKDYFNMAPSKVFCFEHVFIKNSDLYNASLNVNYINLFNPILDKINFLEEDVLWKVHLAKSLMLPKMESKKEISLDIKDNRKIAIYTINNDDGGLIINNDFHKNEKNNLFIVDSSDKVLFRTCDQNKKSVYVMVEYERI